MLLAALTVAATLAAQQTDTTIPARAGTRLEIENFGGSSVVRTWDRPAIRIVADHSGRDRIEIRDLGTVLTVKSQSRYGAQRTVDYSITVPVRTDLSISGVYNDVTVSGVKGAISAETVNGQIHVTGGDGYISLHSVEGEVSLADAKGRIELGSVNAGIRVRNAEGDITAESVNGDVTLDGITSARVDATSINGEIRYQGTIQDGGRYGFSTHNGDITVSVGESANATVLVSTYSGEFESSFPVKLTQTRRNRFQFLLGSGSARLDLESFQGTIRLGRPGEARSGRPPKNQDNHEERD
ncbi:MAG: DUF4097 family beta strand repeat protein [Gemmatimonadetes bacterium]|nr:DUF4097 family beta strand repeat protein [Gemmatimonadota bacterium]